MKNRFLKAVCIVSISLITISCSSSDEEEIEIIDISDTVTETNYDISSILSRFDGIDAVSYSVSGNTVSFTTTDLPNHTSPYWDSSHDLYEAYNGTNSDWNKNPNSIGEQNITFTMTLNPSEATIKSATPLGPIGIIAIQRTLSKGRLSGFLSGAGAGFADVTYSVLAGLGITFIIDFLTKYSTESQIIGGIFLIILGVRLFYRDSIKQFRQPKTKPGQ